MKIRFLIGAFFFLNITVASTLLERHNVIKMFSKATKDYSLIDIKLSRRRNEVTDNFRQDIEDIQSGYLKNTKEFIIPSFILKIVKNNGEYTVYELYKSGEQHNLKKSRSTP